MSTLTSVDAIPTDRQITSEGKATPDHGQHDAAHVVTVSDEQRDEEMLTPCPDIEVDVAMVQNHSAVFA